MLEDRVVKRFEMKRLEVPCVWYKFNKNKVALRLVSQDLENKRILALSSNNSCFKKIGIAHYK